MIYFALTAAVAVASLLLVSCNDKIDVNREYDFALSCWHLPSEIVPGEQVEIRFTLTRQGDFKGAEYYIGYIQLEGKGEVSDSEGTLLVNRESCTNCGLCPVWTKAIPTARSSRSFTRRHPTNSPKSGSLWSTISARSESWRSRSTAEGRAIKHGSSVWHRSIYFSGKYRIRHKFRYLCEQTI